MQVNELLNALQGALGSDPNRKVLVLDGKEEVDFEPVNQSGKDGAFLLRLKDNAKPKVK